MPLIKTGFMPTKMKTKNKRTTIERAWVLDAWKSPLWFCISKKKIDAVGCDVMAQRCQIEIIASAARRSRFMFACIPFHIFEN
jgi:hypothetical protein